MNFKQQTNLQPISNAQQKTRLNIEYWLLMIGN